MKKTIAASFSMLSVLTLSFLVGCATPNTDTPEEQVKARASDRWKARIEDKLEKDYALHTPSFRATTTYPDYLKSFGGAATWLAAEVTSVDCEAEKCVVKMKVEARPVLARRNSPNITAYFDEVWLFEDRQWWFFPKH